MPQMGPINWLGFMILFLIYYMFILIVYLNFMGNYSILGFKEKSFSGEISVSKKNKGQMVDNSNFMEWNFTIGW